MVDQIVCRAAGRSDDFEEILPPEIGAAEVGVEREGLGNPLINEGLLVTTTPAGGPHVAPMGPVVDASLTDWTLRPFVTSTTFELLRKRPRAVFHVVDDVLPVVRAALGYTCELEFESIEDGGWVIRDCCHWFELEVFDWDLTTQRSEARARVVHRGVKRPFGDGIARSMRCWKRRFLPIAAAPCESRIDCR